MAQTSQRQKPTIFSCYPLCIIDMNRNRKQVESEQIETFQILNYNLFQSVCHLKINTLQKVSLNQIIK